MKKNLDSYPQLSKLVATDDPDSVFNEVKTIIVMCIADFDTRMISRSFDMIKQMYSGQFPGYRACTTSYHDLHHTTDVLLATVRLIHGAFLMNTTFEERTVNLALISAMFHDAGYIQEENDLEGTGAKHTKTHVQRGIRMLERHGEELGLKSSDLETCRIMILSTDLNEIEMEASSKQVDLLCRILGAADILAQMAERAYLEKLKYLYQEFKEARIKGYESDVDLIRKTFNFHEIISQRLTKMLKNAQLYLKAHFTHRWEIPSDLYSDAIKRQKKFLARITSMPDEEMMAHLKRTPPFNELYFEKNLNNPK